jgi:aspartate aminotransferase-like enzyme
MEPEYLARFLEGPEVDSVALVHSEAATGALAPLAELAAAVHARPGVMLLVDGTSAVGGLPVETDLWGLDFVFTGSGQALALPPGLALAVASPRLLDRAASLPDRGRYFDIPALHELTQGDELMEAPALPFYHALDHQLGRIAGEGGIEARWRRHYELLLVVERWVAGRTDVRFLPQEGRRSWTVSCLELPRGVSSSSVIGRMAASGLTIAPGADRLRERTIRLGHMGEMDTGSLLRMLEVLGGKLGD